MSGRVTKFFVHTEQGSRQYMVTETGEPFRRYVPYEHSGGGHAVGGLRVTIEEPNGNGSYVGNVGGWPEVLSILCSLRAQVYGISGFIWEDEL